jgi:sterol desaturase/sphingolipid hydroxylase (fatty acid hydroxylase superfamily)
MQSMTDGVGASAPIAPLIPFAALALAAVWELLTQRKKLLPARALARTSNLGLWLVNGLTAAVMFKYPKWVLGMLGLDFLAYAYHWVSHCVRPLWELHKYHHSHDPVVDWSTTVRHHTAEYLAVTAVIATATAVFNIPIEVVGTYSILAFVLAASTHVNARWPRWAEKMGPAIITLDLHLWHHTEEGSRQNLGSVLSIWDRMFGTFNDKGVV